MQQQRYYIKLSPLEVICSLRWNPETLSVIVHLSFHRMHYDTGRDLTRPSNAYHIILD
jgi:hypothetical protein